MVYLQKKTQNMHNVVTLTTFVFNTNQNHYYYEMLLEKRLYK